MKLYEFFETAKNEKSTEEEFQEHVQQLTKDAITAVYNCISNLEFTENSQKAITYLLRNNQHEAKKCTFEFSRYNSELYVAGEKLVSDPLVIFFSKKYETFSNETGFDFKIVIYPEIPGKICIQFESNPYSVAAHNFGFVDTIKKEDIARKVILPLLKEYSNDTYEFFRDPLFCFGVSLDNWKGF